jgi:hypothetical protein
MYRKITLPSSQKKEAQYYSIDTQNLEMFPIVFGQ